MKWCFTFAILLSSFLLLNVQPMLAKVLLPLVGGAAGVWAATMLFFQLLLLGGYGYAALSSRFLSPFKQSVLHVGCCLLAVCIYTPLTLDTLGNTQIMLISRPEIWIVITLLCTIGLPYFLLSANSSMLQRWYFAAYAKEPYHLFSASNIGSFIGLFAYPLCIEWLFDSSVQLSLWSYGFMAMALVLALLSMGLGGASAPKEITKNLSTQTLLMVVFLAFIPSSLFLSTTVHVTSDIGAFPLLWVIPLSLYLFSFVIVFASWSERWINIAQNLHPVALLCIGISHLLPNYSWAIASNFLFFFIIAVSCHGALARLRPSPQQLTMYFFWVAAGGALGGLGNLLAQYAFNDIYEYPLVLILSILVLPGKRELYKRLQAQKIGAALSIIIGGILLGYLYTSMQTEDVKRTLKTERNFYGVSHITRDTKFTYFEHGTTIHGMQSISKDTDHLTTYYAPVDDLISQLPKTFFTKEIGAVGMGVGTVACADRHGTNIDFFEINPQVINIAKNTDYFTFLNDCLPKAEIFTGDGRLLLMQQQNNQYSLLILDAFSSDSVPMHLLTKEAFALYSEKLTKGGLIMINVSSRYLNLSPFITKVAQSIGLDTYKLSNFPTEAESEFGEIPSIWLVLTEPEGKWSGLLKKNGYTLQSPEPKTPLWTDDYSNIIPAIIW